MSKSRAGAVALLIALAAPAAGARATVLGPDAAACAEGAGRSAMIVRVTGFKARAGELRVQLYGGDPARYFDKGTWLRRVDVAVPRSGSAEVCVAVPRPGSYAVSVRHDLNGSGKADTSDGGGMSGNPPMSLFDILFRRKPAPDLVTVRVGTHAVVVPVVLRYVQGGSFRPVRTAAS